MLKVEAPHYTSIFSGSWATPKCMVWAHHMFETGMNPFLGSVFVLLTLLIAIPSAVKVFNWLATLWRGNIHFTPAMLFAIGFVSMFISGGLTGIWLGNSTIDMHVHDTYFVVAHFHLVMGVAAIIVFTVQLLFIINFFNSAFKGRRVTKPKPWQAATLEWTAPIHPPHSNWPGEIPEVYRWPYDYGKEGRDCIPQTEPPEPSPKLVKNPA